VSDGGVRDGATNHGGTSDAALLRTMLVCRALETRLAARPDRGFQLFSAGEEAVAAGLCAVLGPDDQLLCSGRSIAPALARGLDPAAVAAELLGRLGGPCRGRAGRGHLAQPAAGFLGAHAVVAGNLTIAAGAALAFQAARRPGIVAVLFGDGAAGAGALHETLNIAALWRLPLLLVCSNNGWSISTATAAHLAPARVADLARPFGIAAATVDGTDAPAMRDAAAALAAHVRGGAGPALLEAVSVRLGPHSTSARENRPAAEVVALAARCPIARLSAALGEAVAAPLRAEADAAAEAAFRAAEASPPATATEFDDAG
jgi:TPP-dependent pyruvate/acetoin dehydrogenase alpha subunit